MKPEIYDNWNRPPTINEPGGGKRITESAGYIPVRVQVENMIIAGERLGEYRKEKYDFGEGMEVPDDAVPDITRSASFDMADASTLARSLSDTLKKQAADAQAKADQAKSEADAAIAAAGSA